MFRVSNLALTVALWATAAGLAACGGSSNEALLGPSPTAVGTGGSAAGSSGTSLATSSGAAASTTGGDVSTGRASTSSSIGSSGTGGGTTGGGAASTGALLGSKLQGALAFPVNFAGELYGLLPDGGADLSNLDCRLSDRSQLELTCRLAPLRDAGAGDAGMSEAPDSGPPSLDSGTDAGSIDGGLGLDGGAIGLDAGFDGGLDGGPPPNGGGQPPIQHILDIYVTDRSSAQLTAGVAQVANPAYSGANVFATLELTFLFADGGRLTVAASSGTVSYEANASGLSGEFAGEFDLPPTASSLNDGGGSLSGTFGAPYCSTLGSY